MRLCKNILAVVQTAAEATIVLPKAKRLADMHGARVHAIRTAYESLADFNPADVEASTELKNFILQGEEAQLKEAIAICGTSIPDIETATLWDRKSWEAILLAATTVNADIIIKAEEETESARRIRTPDDWNLLRESTIPVLLCGAKEWSATPRIIAAVDVFDDDHFTLNNRLLQEAEALTEGIGGQLQVISAFPSLRPWSPSFATFQNYQQMMRDIESDAKDRLESMLEAHDMVEYTAKALEGDADDVIQQVAEEENADLLIMGTTARAGLEAIVIGNTAEKLLHKTTIDVLTVP